MSKDVRDAKRKEPGFVQSQGRRQVSDSLVVLDNPDDGEIAQTGDASDFAGEAEPTRRVNKPSERPPKSGARPPQR